MSVGVTKVDFMPREHVDSISDVRSFEIIPSGSAVNFALVLAKLGQKTGLLSCISSDEFGDYAYSYLKDNSVDVTYLTKIEDTELSTSIYAINKKIMADISYTQQNAPESKFVFTNDMKGYLENTKLLYTTESFLRRQDSRKSLFEILEFASEHNIQVAYDPSVKEDLWIDDPEVIIDSHENILEYVDIFFSDTEEIKWLSNTISLGEAVKFVYELGPNLIVLRHGTRGVLIFDGKNLIKVPLQKVETVNIPNGNDVFNAGFLYLHMKKSDLKTCGSFAQYILSLKNPDTWHFKLDPNKLKKFLKPETR